MGEPKRQEHTVSQSKTKPDVADLPAEEEVTYLSKRHRVSSAIVREIIRRIGTAERSAVEREIRKGMARR
jgi:Mor family transcriptional regulator